MYRGSQLDERVFDADHIKDVLDVMQKIFSKYFGSFLHDDAQGLFKTAIKEFDKEQPAYLSYFDPDSLEEYEDDPNAFKKHTRHYCPIIRRCLMSQDEIMNDYKASFNRVSGRKLLDTVRTIADFGDEYVEGFNGAAHEKIQDYQKLKLEPLGDEKHTCAGVVGYGIQSNFLYMLYPQAFAYRAQDAVWSLFFLSDKKHFDFGEGSEFVMYSPKYGTGEQNFLYPPEMFGFYALSIYRWLQEACREEGIKFDSQYRYTYLDAFLKHIAATERDNINFLKKSSDYVENHWY